MKHKIFAALLLSGALLAIAAPAGAGAAKPHKAPTYKHYVACGTDPKSKPSHSCASGDDKGAYFKSTKKDVLYSICVDFPRGKTLCAKAQQAKRGTLYVNRITSTILGRHKVTWFVSGKRVGFFIFNVT